MASTSAAWSLRTATSHAPRVEPAKFALRRRSISPPIPFGPTISLRSLALHAAITVIGVVYQHVSLIFGESSSSKEESAASGLTGKPPEQSQFQGGMGKIFHTRLKPNGFVQHALVVREALETRFSVISPHAASSDATEWKVSVREMHDGIIYATAPKGHFAQNFFPGVPFIRQHIKG